LTHHIAGAAERGQPVPSEQGAGTSNESKEMRLIEQIVARANPNFYGERFYDVAKGKWGYAHRPRPVTVEALQMHHQDKREYSVAVSLEHDRDGESYVSAICFDLDDKSGSQRERVRHVAGQISAMLPHNGFQPFVVQSGSGSGYHVWVFLDREVRKDWARTLMLNLLKALGLKEGANGGVAAGVVECFPKAGPNSLIALPFGRKSILMQWVENSGLLVAQNIPADLPISEKRKPGPKPRGTTPKSESVDLEAAVGAFLSEVDGSDYDPWLRALALIKSALGEDGWRFALEWSSQFDGYKGERDVREKWDRGIGTPKAPPEAFWGQARKNGYRGGLPSGIRLERKSKQAEPKDVLLEIVRDMPTVMSREGAVYVCLGPRHWEEVGSPAVRRHLNREFFHRTGAMASTEQVKSAQGFLDAKEAQTDNVFIRCARRDGRVFFAVEDEAHTVLEIGPGGVTECDEPPVKFRRGDCLPAPVGSVGTFEDFKLAIPADEDNLVVLAAVLVKGLLEPDTGHPICLFHGPANSAKSATMRTAVGAIDPKAGICAAPPKSEGDLIAAASSTYVVTFDNVSSLAGLSDAYCRLATGGGLKKRQLYTDNAAFTADVMRPLCLTAIDPEVVAQDLVSRLVKIELMPMAPEERLTDGEVNEMRERLLPRIRRYLLDLAARVLASDQVDARHADIRMDSFANIGERVARIMGREPGWFVRTYAEMIAESSIDEADSDLFVRCIRRMVSNGGNNYVRMNCEQLLGEMNELVRSGEVAASLHDLPRNPRALASRIVRALPVLRRLGYEARQEGSRREWVFASKAVPHEDF
jgi:hypothetical protein